MDWKEYTLAMAKELKIGHLLLAWLIPSPIHALLMKKFSKKNPEND